MKAKKHQNLFALILDKMGSWSLLICGRSPWSPSALWAYPSSSWAAAST